MAALEPGPAQVLAFVLVTGLASQLSALCLLLWWLALRSASTLSSGRLCEEMGEAVQAGEVSSANSTPKLTPFLEMSDHGGHG